MNEDPLEGYTPDWQQGQQATQVAEDPLVGYTPDWRAKQQSTADPLAGYTPDWKSKQPKIADEASVGSKIWDVLKQQGNSLIQFQKYFLTAIPALVPGPGQLNALKRSKIARDMEAAKAGDLDATERLTRGKEGAALLASTAAAELTLASIPIKAASTGFGISQAYGLIPKALRWFTAEAIGGSTYGALRELEPDESRASALAFDAATFPIAGAALHGVFKGTGFLAGSLLGREVVDKLAALPEAGAKKVASTAYDFYKKLLPTDSPSSPAVATAQKAAVEAAVAGVKDIQETITVYKAPTATQTDVWRAVFKDKFQLYKETYGLIRKESDPMQQAKYIANLREMEAGLTQGQRTVLMGKEAVQGDAYAQVLAEASGAPSREATAAIQNDAMDQAVAEIPTREIATDEARAAAEKQIADLDELTKKLGEASEATESMVAAARTRHLVAKAVENDDAAALVNQLAPGANDLAAQLRASLDQVGQGKTIGEVSAKAPRHEAWQPSDMSDLGGVENTPVPLEADAAKLVARLPAEVQKLIEEEGGGVARRAAVKLSLLAGAGYTEYKAEQQDVLWKKASLRAVAVFLGGAGAFPGSRTNAWLMKTEWRRKLVRSVDLAKYSTQVGQTGIDIWHGISAKGRAEAVINAKNAWSGVWKDAPENLRAAIAAEEGALAPEFHTMTPLQQREALAIQQHHRDVENWMQMRGWKESFNEIYFQSLFPKETYDSWLSQMKHAVKTQNAPLVQQLSSVRGVMQMAQAKGFKSAMEDFATVQADHTVNVSRIDATRTAIEYWTGMQQIVDIPTDRVMPNDQWRPINVLYLNGKMAPADIATALERMHNHSSAIPYVDGMRAALMKSIMLWPWEHGVNGLRAAWALDGTGRSYFKALSAIKASDPITIEASRTGTMLFRQPDFLDESAVKYRAMLDKIGLGKISALHQMSDRALWERWIPAVGLAAWSRDMKVWTERTGGKYLRGSPEYEAAARRASEFANKAMGKIPDLLQDPTLAKFSRVALFSPAWLRTRLSITAHAMGDLQKILSGELNPRDAQYLPYKLKAVALGVAFTWLMSKTFTGKEPEFNPNTTKLYARTGLRDKNGREQGLDLVGWWQDDLKLSNDPFSFLENRMSPVWRTMSQTVSGRDAFGNEITGAEKLENLINQTGPMAGLPAAAVNPPTSGGELLRTASDVFALGNVSALPRVADVAVAKMAEKLLRKNGLSVHRDDIYDLSRLMKQNMAVSGDWYAENLNSWFAYKRRAAEKQHPLTHLWLGEKRSMFDSFNK